jgi:hypothetical protein
MRARARIAFAAPLAVALAVVAVRPAAAWELGVEAGVNRLVSGRTYDDGGASAGASLTWPVDVAKGWPELRFGVTGFLHDIGQTTREPVDGRTGAPLGRLVSGHRDAWGAGWRLESTLLARGPWVAGADAGWNYYRIEDDVTGEVRGGLSSTGFSLGGSAGRAIGSGQALALALRYHRLFNDATGRYATAAVEWRWRGAREGSR